MGYTAIYLFLGFFIGALLLFHENSFILLLVGLPLGLLISTALPNGVFKLRTLSGKLRWWHALWGFLLLSGLVFRIRVTNSAIDNPLDFWGLFRVGLMSIIGFALLYHLVVHRLDWIKSLCQGFIALLAGYTIVCLISVIWSVHPLWSLYKSTEYLVDLALIAAIVTSIKTEQEFKGLFDWTWILLGLLAGTVWLGVFLWPDQAIDREVGLLGFSIRGVFPAMETNGVGEIGAILGAIAFTRLLLGSDGKPFYWITFFIALATLICSQSRSPLTGFSVAILVILFSARRLGFAFFFPLVILTVLSLTSGFDFGYDFFLRGQRDEDFESLSGRTHLWALGWEMFKEQPITGYGAYAGTRFTGITDTMGSGNSSILNTWLEILLGVGLPGGLLVLGALCGVWAILLKRSFNEIKGTLPHHLTVEALGILAIISVRSMFTAQLIWHPPITFLLVLGYAEFIRRQFKKGHYENTPGPQLLSAAWR